MIEKIDNVYLILPFIKTYFPKFSVKDDPFGKMLCYKKNNQVIGFISYSLIYERAELNYIVTDKDYRRRGIGQKLLDAALMDLKNNKVESFSLEVSIHNQNAIKFYLKNGFEKKAIRKNYYDSEDAYLMVMKVR